MTSSSLVLVTKPHKGVCLLTLNRPEKRNALDAELIQQWQLALDHIENDPDSRVVMLNGAGEHFCAGADIAAMQKMTGCSYDDNFADAMQLANLLKKIYTFSKPVIGLIHGATMGGALGVIACCDIVIAADNSVFCFSEAKIGLAPFVISPYVVPVIGEKLARYYFLTADKFNAEKALTLQLIQQVVSSTHLSESGLTLAKHLLKNSPQALREIKQLLPRIAHENYSDKIIHFTADKLATIRTSTEAQEGLKAFIEKRSPSWE